MSQPVIAFAILRPSVPLGNPLISAASTVKFIKKTKAQPILRDRMIYQLQQSPTSTYKRHLILVAEHDKLTTTAPPFTRRLGYPGEHADMEKAQIDECGLRPSQKGIHEDYPEASEPPMLHWWRAIPLGLVFIAIAVRSGVVLEQTRRGLGFDINLIDTQLSRVRQFLKSFGPSILFTPLFLWFTASYGTIKLLKPYIGAEKDRVDSRSPGGAVFLSFRDRHWAVFILSCIAISGGIFHSLAGAFFQIVPTSQKQEARVRIAGKTDLGYDNVGFTPFVDAAGFVGAVSRIGALYSPFILNDTTSKTGNTWVVPSFTLADPGAADQGGEVNLTFRGLSVQARCAPVPSPVISGPDTPDSYNMTGTLSHNCSATSNVISNGTVSTLVTTTQSQVTRYFSLPMIEEHDLTVKLVLSYDGPFISDVADRGNVSFLSWGPSGTGWTSSDPRVEGIGDAIRFALAGSISDANSVVGYAEEAVRLFQATLAPSTFIVGPSYLGNATQYVETYSLVAIAPVAHAITVMCAIVGLVLVVLSIRHSMWWRKELWANAAPSVTTTVPALAA
ncbi:uncharacterized protein EI90DRAFT_3122728 [Cantharellus anzutake]|uniref:uncharacterized protein n=1 Tax=Cantharellus anzutake TaxID=1750568 RepID=UPI001904C8D6|nr:uncharacterized protein EI90DRAFT_3122728 [Cantharellus anzutake]KAF8332298.1 hypothetical protein EI90DRAFT_3122728 [Cantharellus anzutake]